MEPGQSLAFANLGEAARAPVLVVLHDVRLLGPPPLRPMVLSITRHQPALQRAQRCPQPPCLVRPQAVQDPLRGKGSALLRARFPPVTPAPVEADPVLLHLMQDPQGLLVQLALMPL